MAIVKCPEEACGKPVSTKAETCPHCGCPLDAKDFISGLSPADDECAKAPETQLAPPTFSRWPETPKVMSGASKNRIRLKRVADVSDPDWAILERMWFWLVTRGTNTHTFGYIRRELPTQAQGPLARWIALAKGSSGKGSEVRQTSAGEVIRVNVDADSITIEGSGNSGSGSVVV